MNYEEEYKKLNHLFQMIVIHFDIATNLTRKDLHDYMVSIYGGEEE